MRKKVEEKKEFNLEEAFALWKQTGKNGEYLKGKTTSECGDCEIWGFYAKEKKNEKQPDLTICKKLDSGKMEEIAVLWATKDDTYFAYDEFEKVDVLKELGKTKYSIQRSKGLGENTAEMMSKTTMNPATRRLVAITPAEAAATARMFDTLLGDDLPARKAFIAAHGAEYMKTADL